MLQQVYEGEYPENEIDEAYQRYKREEEKERADEAAGRLCGLPAIYRLAIEGAGSLRKESE